MQHEVNWKLSISVQLTSDILFCFLPGTSDNDYRALYKLLSCGWILIGLASVALLLSNITDLYKRIAPQSKNDDEEKDENKVNKTNNFWLTNCKKSAIPSIFLVLIVILLYFFLNRNL